MIRGGALALGAIMTLGALSRAEAQDTSAFDAGSLLPLAGVLPALPQNWDDLPLQLKASEQLGYNSNVFGTPTNSTLRPLGSFESISNFGASTKWNVVGDQFFADVNYGFYRYLGHAFLDEAHSSADAGVNWIYTSSCSGRLVASEASTPSQPGQQVAVNVINTVTSIGFNETGKCGLTGNWGFIFNSGTTTSTNSSTLDKLNDFENVFISAGITYTVAETNTLQLLTTVTGTRYTNRGDLTDLVGLLTKFTEDQINLSYTRVINPNLSLVASIGLVGVSSGDFDVGYPSSGFEPQYSLSATWSITPKIGLTGSVSRVVTVPTSLVGNLQLTEGVSFGLTYQWTPKVSLAASVGASRSSNFGANGTSSLNLDFAQNSYNFSANAGYNLTPFLNASLNYSYYRRTQVGGLVTPTSVAFLTVSYAPY